MRYFYLRLLFTGLVTVFFSSDGFGQKSWDDFTGEERAFFYHQSRRVEILNPELFHLFEFTDSIPYINDTLPDYSYVERQIVGEPDLLVLHSDEMKRKSSGVLSDLAIRFALWELDAVLQFRNSTDEKDKPLKDKLSIFEGFVLENIPQSAIRTLGNGDYVLAKTVNRYYSPSLTVGDKLASILNSGYSQLDQMLILNSIMLAQEKYVDLRAKEIFNILGGSNSIEGSYLSAVGDGRDWAEIKGGFNTPYTIGLPDEKGLFNFFITQKQNEETSRDFLEVKPIVDRQFETDKINETVIHFDVFGYHPERQTTIVVQKGGKSYVMYGKNEHRLVSPDSSYGEGTTYWRLMYDLEFNHIANLKEDLYGKHGYEYQIDQFEKKIEVTLLQIKKTEHRLDILRYTPEGKPKMQKKKKVKKKNLGTSAQDGQGHPTSVMSKLDKKRNIEQNRLVQLQGKLEAQKNILAQLKIDMEMAYEYLVRYETKLDFMKKNMGYTIMEFEEDNHLYTFKDGTTYNYLTQDFVFPKGRVSEVFQIYHISFGEKVLDDKVDENFIHMNVSKRIMEDEYTLKRIVRDDQKNEISISDSIQIMELFYHLAKKEINATLNMRAGGSVKKEGNHYFRDSTVFIQGYDKEAEANNGVLLYKAVLRNTMDLTVTVYDDPMVPVNFNTYKGVFDKLKAKQPGLNEVDFYSGVRAKHAGEIWINTLKVLAEKWVTDERDRKVILGKLKKMKSKKVSFMNGTFTAKVPAII